MLFSFHKKVLRDRAAGLVFGWRTYNRNGFFHSILAISVTILLVTFLLFGFEVKLEGNRSSSSTDGSVYKTVQYISVDHEQISELKHFRSPLPEKVKLYSKFDQTLLKELKTKMLEVPAPKVELAVVSALIKPLNLPELVVKSNFLPVRPIVEQRDLGKSERVVKVVLDDTSRKLPLDLLKAINESDKWMAPPQYLGKELSYTVIIDKLGKIVFCSLSRGEEIKPIENWLRSISFPQRNKEIIINIGLKVVKEK